MNKDFRTRAVNALLGSAIGDAISWPSLFHRSRTLPAWTRRIRREMDAQREDAGVLRVPMPFSLNQSPAAFDLQPTDDTEWTAWMMLRLLQDDGQMSAASIEASWKVLATDADSIRGWVSTKSALRNLRKGMLPPVTGRDNPHYFDDGAICRAIPIGIAYAGNTDDAVRLAGLEAEATNAEDGIWVAQAAAAGMSVGCSGGSTDEVVAAAVAVLPGGSWSKRVVTDVLADVNGDLSVLEHLPAFFRHVNVEYSDGCVGPETLALALAIISAAKGEFSESLYGSLAFSKNADSLPALVGALAGGVSSQNVIPATWETSLRSLRGVCIPSMSGCEYIKTVDQFITACESR